mmetsp:Transcript_23742/g.35432  ORF Transcript_23742/g.35432 Transcript_23742/m.35432 type:complete len:391 (-) Transcript_23742:242-1414(-)
MKLSFLPIFISLLSGALVRSTDEDSLSLTDATSAIFSYFDSGSGTDLSMYLRFDDGLLEGPRGFFPIGGGSILGFSGSPISKLILSEGTRLFVRDPFENANTVSMYDTNPYGALLLDTADSGGNFPCSLASSGDVIYVLNCAFNDDGTADGAGAPSVTAFRVEGRLKKNLRRLPNFSRALTEYENQGGSQIGITPNGKFLIVAILGKSSPEAGALVVFSLNSFGQPSKEPVYVLDSLNQPVAFEFAVYNGKTFVYAVTQGDATMLAYRVEENGSLSFVSSAVGSPDGPGAGLCWVARYGNYLYGTNAPLSSVSSWVIDPSDGSASLLEVDAATEGLKAPVDVLASDSILYVVNRVGGTITQFEIADDGSLNYLIETGVGATGGIALVNFE